MAVPLLLLVLFDGLSHELFQEHYQNYGNLSKFYMESPTIKQGIKPVFPTITTPNLMSIATGLYVENHGINDNIMFPYQNELQKYNHSEFRLFTESDEDGTWWDNGLVMPVWTLNELSSSESNLRFSGGMFWSGSGATYRNKTIEYYEAYNSSSSWYREVDTIIKWFTANERPANCVFLYFDNPDLVLHKSGIQSKEFLDSMQEVDDIVGYLMEKIEDNKLTDSLNVIITADHGMVDVPVNHYNELSKLNISKDYYSTMLNSIIWNIDPFPDDHGSLYETLLQGSLIMNYSVWTKDDFPETAHYKNAPHVGSIILVSDFGFKTVPNKYANLTIQGAHGYNNTFSAMKSIFMARGPAFNSSAELASFDIVDLYPLMCFILDISPHPNNGSLQHVSSILNNFESNRLPNEVDRSSETNYAATGVGIFLIILSIVAVSLFVYRMYNQYWHRKRSAHKYGLVEGGNPFLSGSDDDDDL